MNNFERLLEDTAKGWGFWPDPETGRWVFSAGTTMKQLRSFAQYTDNETLGWTDGE